LGRLHRLGLGHGDPHLRNFLFDANSGRCRIIDFETRFDRFDERSTARDAAVLALAFLRAGSDDISDKVLEGWFTEMGDGAGRTIGLLRNPGWRLGTYWRLLGYR
jgi:tRNA A-37 threonylcarbamoyl transferase component Bud32